MDFGLIYLNARRRLRQQRDLLERLFEASRVANRDMRDAARQLNVVTGEWGSVGTVNVSPALQQIERMEQHLGESDIYAGTVLLVLDDILAPVYAGYKESGGLGDPGPQVAGYSVRRIFKAGGNNFRHYEEWRRDAAQPTSRQTESIAPIATLLNIPLLPAVPHTVVNIMAPQILEKLGTSGYASVELLVREAMYAMVVDLGVKQNRAVLWSGNEDGLP